MLIGMQFARTYWLKGYRKVTFLFILLVIISLAFTIFYLFAGGPQRASEVFFRFIQGI
jgi:hypothetical protein